MEQLLSERIINTPPSFIRNILKVATDENIISFAGGLPNPISFPSEELLINMKEIVERYGSSVFQYAATAGLPALREYIADRYNRLYEMQLCAEDILITTGSQQALDLIAKTFVNKKDNVIIEEPGYLGAIQAFSQYEPEFCPVSLEADGLSLAGLKKALEKNIKMMYVVPNFQNPTGLTYGLGKREAIYKLIKDKKTILIEDDPYGELRFEGEKLPYIGAGKLENSILLGSFSKIVTPGMRLGYIICKNHEMLSNISKAKEASDLHTNIFSQYLILQYLKTNDLESHIKTICELYKEQANAMKEAIKEFFPKEVTITNPEGGMFLWATLPQSISALEIFPKALEKGVSFVPGDPFYIGQHDVNTMRLNYTNSNPETIREGIKRLGNILKEYC